MPGRCASGQVGVTVGGGSGGAAGRIITAVNFVTNGPSPGTRAGFDQHGAGNGWARRAAPQHKPV